MDVKPSDFFLDVFKDLGSDCRRQLRRRQYAIDNSCGEARALIIGLKDRPLIGLKDRPRGATAKPENFGLLLKRSNSDRDENLLDLPDPS